MNDTTKKRVAIFRLQLFKVSEPFIAGQVSALRNFSPIYIGRERFGPAPDSLNFALQDLDPRRLAPGTLWNAATRDPRLFVKLLGEFRPSLIHAHFGPDAVFALPLAKSLGVPLVTTFHGFDVTVSTRKLLSFRSPYITNYLLFRRQLARDGAFFLCVSEHIRRAAIALGFPEERTKIHYMGIDTDAIMSPLIRGGNRDILHVARLVDKKGTEFLIRGFSRISARHPSVRLIIIGDGPLRGSLQSLAESLGVSKATRFLGSRTNRFVLDQLQKASIFVLPSVTARSGDTEGLPITILEAAAAGIPVVATRHGGIPEAIIDGETGLLVSERDDVALAAAMDRLLSNEEERVQMGMAARSFVKSRFNLYTQTAALEQFYRQVLRSA